MNPFEIAAQCAVLWVVVGVLVIAFGVATAREGHG